MRQSFINNKLIIINKMGIVNSINKVLLILLKDFSKTHTVTSIAKELKLSRVGVWKILKRLESDQFIELTPVGSGKTSASTADIDWDNVLADKSFALYLAQEAVGHRRWRVAFLELENLVDFLILYGSILALPKEARDIDIVGVSQKKNFIKIQNIIDKIQKTQSKKIHAINFTESEFKEELKRPNKAFVDAVKKGVVLFGQEKFVQFIKKVR